MITRSPCSPASARAAALVALLAVTVAVPRTGRAGDPSQVWRTLESRHFVVHYYEPNEDIARRVATVAEHSHAVLAPVLGHRPREKTNVVITDDTDSANGWAMVAPRNLIWLYATAPAGDATLNDHDDWLYLLFAHEYSHILHLDTTGGLPALYNRVFGKTWMPNQIQPRWFVEGLATYQESKRSSSGRTRAAIFDMYLRAAVLEGRPLDLDAMSSGPLRFPQGNTAYLYGSHFLKYIADRYGDAVIAGVSHEYGRHIIPWNLGRAVRQATGKNFDELFAEWREHLTRRYLLQKAAVERRGAIEGRRLTRAAQGNYLPRYSPDGRELAWSRSDGWSRSGYRAMPLGGDATRTRELALIDGAGWYAFLPDGRGLLLERFQAYRTQYDFADLWTYDFASRQLTRLTWGLRAGTPDVSPDGTRAAFILNGRSKMRLAVMPLVAGATPEVVWEGPDRFDQALTPAWSPDGKRLAFSAWLKGGYRDVFVLDLETRQARRLTEDRAIDTDPRWSPDGRWVYFASDRSGIYNLYAADAETGTLRQVTNVLGGVFAFDVSRDGRRAAYVGFVADGYELFEVELDEARWLEPEVHVDDRPDPVSIPDDPDVVISGPRPYRPLETLAPSSWAGSYAIGSNQASATVQVYGGDVAGHHSYSLGVTLDGLSGETAVGAGYSYGRLWPSLSCGIGRGVGQPGGLILDGANTRYDEESWGARVGVGLPVLRRPGLSSDLGFSYNVGWTRQVDEPPPPDPNASLPRAPELGVAAGVSMRWSLSTVRRYLFTLGPKEGRHAVLNVRLNHPGLGADWEALEVTWALQQYLAMPWRGGHIASLRLAGGLEQARARRDGPYVLGGQTTQDVIGAIIDSTRVWGTGVLRGYDAASMIGRQYHLLNAEYRVPIRILERGLGTLPAYLRRLHGAALLDAGNAFDGPFEAAELRAALGAALRLDVTFGFFAAGTFELGAARGLTEGGRGEVWLLLTQGL